MPYTFKGNPTHTLGVEVELQLIDAETLALSNSIQPILDRVPEKWSDKVKPELMQSYCEFNTDVCETVGAVERDLAEKLEWGQATAEELGLKLAWGGSHPFSPWYEQLYSPGKRYLWLTRAMQHITRRLVVFGLHVHVGVDSGDKAIQLCDRFLRHLPTLLALSTNSPITRSISPRSTPMDLVDRGSGSSAYSHKRQTWYRPAGSREIVMLLGSDGGLRLHRTLSGADIFAIFKVGRPSSPTP